MPEQRSERRARANHQLQKLEATSGSLKDLRPVFEVREHAGRVERAAGACQLHNGGRGGRCSVGAADAESPPRYQPQGPSWTRCAAPVCCVLCCALGGAASLLLLRLAASEAAHLLVSEEPASGHTAGDVLERGLATITKDLYALRGSRHALICVAMGTVATLLVGAVFSARRQRAVPRQPESAGVAHLDSVLEAADVQALLQMSASINLRTPEGASLFAPCEADQTGGRAPCSTQPTYHAPCYRAPYYHATVHHANVPCNVAGAHHGSPPMYRSPPSFFGGQKGAPLPHMAALLAFLAGRKDHARRSRWRRAAPRGRGRKKVRRRRAGRSSR